MESNVEYIKKYILLSDLNNILDLSSVDWNLCDKNAQKSLVKEACKLYMSGVNKLRDIGDILCLNRSTVRGYLKVGAKLGLCNYDSEKTKSINNGKAVIVIDVNNNKLHEFNGINECARSMENIYHTPFYRRYIRNSINTNRPYKGFIFQGANSTIQN
jgi:hypothetical protein